MKSLASVEECEKAVQVFETHIEHELDDCACAYCPSTKTANASVRINGPIAVVVILKIL